MREVIPVYRNSESGSDVPDAYRAKGTAQKSTQKIPKFGGPGGIRTPDLTVMSASQSPQCP
jgi:hypothetical protein